MPSNKYQQIFWSFYSSEPFKNRHFNVRHPVGVVKVDLFYFPNEIFEKLVWIRCQGNCLQLLGFWNLLVFFRFFPPKLVFFKIKSRKKRYGCFFHSICAPDLNFGTKNIGRTKLSTLKTLIFANCCSSKWLLSKKYWCQIYSFIYTFTV